MQACTFQKTILKITVSFHKLFFHKLNVSKNKILP